MKYCVGTPNRGLLLKPNKKWDEHDPSFEFVITGRSDSDFAKEPETRKSVGGHAVFLFDAPVIYKSKMQTSVSLDVTSAELTSGTACAQEMLFVMRILESMGLKVKKPMILEMDNKGAVDIAHNWSVSGRSRHESVRQSFLRELNEGDIIVTKWKEGENNCVDIYTKNVAGPAFERHGTMFVGNDEYMKPDS
jgi:hypothetical protein